jgi:hypothetical protein
MAAAGQRLMHRTDDQQGKTIAAGAKALIILLDIRHD